MPQRGTNTMAEAVSSAVSILSQALEFPDADQPWLQGIIMELVNKNRQMNPGIPGETGQDQQQPGVVDLMGPGGGIGGGPGGGMGAPMGMAPGMPGGMGGGSLPPSNLGTAAGARPPINPDDFARIMAAR